MKTGLIMLGSLFLLGSFGCAPRLAQSSLGETEQRWKEQIKKSYPAWKPPQTVPPTDSSIIQPTASVNEVDSDLAVDTETVIIEEPVAIPVQPATDTIKSATADSSVAAKTYTVKKGDTLSAISVKMYNKSSEVNRIFEANRDIIKDKNIIKPGMQLVIPAL